MKHEHSFDIWTFVKLNHPLCQTPGLSPHALVQWRSSFLSLISDKMSVCHFGHCQLKYLFIVLGSGHSAGLNIRQDLKYWTGGNQQVNIWTLNQSKTVAINPSCLAHIYYTGYSVALIPPRWLSSLYNILFELNIKCQSSVLGCDTLWHTHFSSTRKIQLYLGKCIETGGERGVVRTWSQPRK